MLLQCSPFIALCLGCIGMDRVTNHIIKDNFTKELYKNDRFIDIFLQIFCKIPWEKWEPQCNSVISKYIR